MSRIFRSKIPKTYIQWSREFRYYDRKIFDLRLHNIFMIDYLTYTTKTPQICHFKPFTNGWVL